MIICKQLLEDYLSASLHHPISFTLKESAQQWLLVSQLLDKPKADELLRGVEAVLPAFTDLHVYPSHQRGGRYQLVIKNLEGLLYSMVTQKLDLLSEMTYQENSQDYSHINLLKLQWEIESDTVIVGAFNCNYFDDASDTGTFKHQHLLFIKQLHKTIQQYMPDLTLVSHDRNDGEVAVIASIREEDWQRLADPRIGGPSIASLQTLGVRSIETRLESIDFAQLGQAERFILEQSKSERFSIWTRNQCIQQQFIFSCTPQEAGDILKLNGKDGSWLIRSSSMPGCLSISYFEAKKDKVFHIRFHYSEGKWNKVSRGTVFPAKQNDAPFINQPQIFDGFVQVISKIPIPGHSDRFFNIHSAQSFVKPLQPDSDVSREYLQADSTFSDDPLKYFQTIA